MRYRADRVLRMVDTIMKAGTEVFAEKAAPLVKKVTGLATFILDAILSGFASGARLKCFCSPAVDPAKIIRLTGWAR